MLRLRHLRREVKTALELAIVAPVSTDLINRLALSAGLLEALAELPAESPPALALVPRAVELAEDALRQWRSIEEKSVVSA